MSIVPVYIPSPYNDFVYFLEGQLHKDIIKFKLLRKKGVSEKIKAHFPF